VSAAVTESPIFVVGCPRSGTGLLRDLLRSHPNIAFPSESHFIPAFYRGFGDPRSDRAARLLAARILRLGFVRRWGLSIDPSSLADCRSYSELISRIYDEVARQEGKRRWGDKTPRYVVEIPLLLQLFPAAKILHLYRDGRDVALSFFAVGSGPADVYAAATTWRRCVRIGRRDGRARPDSYMELPYEALVRDPEPTMRRVCEFLGEDFSEAVLRPSRGPRSWRRPMIGRGSPTPRVAETEIVSMNAGRWKREMSESDRSLFEWVAGDLLRELGYETEGLARPPSRRRRLASRVHNSWQRLSRRLNRRGPWPVTFLLMREAAIRRRLRTALRGAP
jgi:hypothetical protein